MGILPTSSTSGDTLANVSKYRQRAVLEGHTIFEQAISESIGMTAVARRAAVDAVCDAFRAKHFRWVRVDGKAVAK